MTPLRFPLAVALVLVLVLLAAPVRAVYEDQHGEYDWQRTNIGPGLDHVLFKVLTHSLTHSLTHYLLLF
jgi:hypothetical protein